MASTLLPTNAFVVATDCCLSALVSCTSSSSLVLPRKPLLLISSAASFTPDSSALPTPATAALPEVSSGTPNFSVAGSEPALPLLDELCELELESLDLLPPQAAVMRTMARPKAATRQPFETDFIALLLTD